jgi:hypothetical protein
LGWFLYRLGLAIAALFAIVGPIALVANEFTVHGWIVFVIAEAWAALASILFT